MYNFFLIIFLIVAIMLILLITLQQGRDANMGSSFRTNASGTLFGSSGSSNFVTRIIVVLATLFFIISLVLGNIDSNKKYKISKWENLTISTKINKTQSINSTK